MISEKEVKHVAKLARIALTQKEVKKFQKELSKILDYIEKLKEVDISKTKPFSFSLPIKNIMREDEFSVGDYKLEIVKKIREMAPAIKNGYLKTKIIFQK